MSHQGASNVIPMKVGIQDIQLIAFWIARKLHFVSRPRPNTIPEQARGNDEGLKRKLPDFSNI